MKVKLQNILLYIFLVISIFPITSGIDVMDFNFLVNFIFLIILVPFVIVNITNKEIIIVFLFVICLTFLAIATNSSPKFFILELNKLLLPLFLVIILPKVVRNQHLFFFYKVAILFIFLQLLFCIVEFRDWSSNYYRYYGSFNNVNITSNLILLFTLYILEYLRLKSKLKNRTILFWFVIYVFLILLTGTRSALIGLLYFVYLFLKQTSKRNRIIVFVIIGLVGFYVAYSLGGFLYRQLRFDADSSTFTRLAIYTLMLEEIAKAKFLLPHGISSHRYLMETEFFGYPVHNDFLEYIYNLGILFYFYFYYLISKLYSFCKKGSFFIFFIVLFLFFSTALHNEMFSIYIWIPIFMIFSLYYFPNDLSYEELKFNCRNSSL